MFPAVFSKIVLYIYIFSLPLPYIPLIYTRVNTSAATFAILFAAIVPTGCHKSVTDATLLPDTLQLEVGDVVFRRCTGLASRMVIWSDADGMFSHTGIVVDSAGKKMVIHAVPGEPDFPGDPDRVKMEPVERFFSTAHAISAGACRPVNAEAGQQAARVAWEKYKEGILFDHAFDDNDTSQLYCTELITHAYHRAGVELVGNERDTIDLPGMHFRCIMPSHLFHSTQLYPIFMSNS